MFNFIITLESKIANRPFSLFVANTTSWSRMFLAAMLRTGDENHELPLLLGLPLSPILCYFSSACLPGEEGWGGGGDIICTTDFCSWTRRKLAANCCNLISKVIYYLRICYYALYTIPGSHTSQFHEVRRCVLIGVKNSHDKWPSSPI